MEMISKSEKSKANTRMTRKIFVQFELYKKYVQNYRYLIFEI